MRRRHLFNANADDLNTDGAPFFVFIQRARLERIRFRMLAFLARRFGHFGFHIKHDFIGIAIVQRKEEIIALVSPAHIDAVLVTILEWRPRRPSAWKCGFGCLTRRTVKSSLRRCSSGKQRGANRNCEEQNDGRILSHIYSFLQIVYMVT